MARTMKTARKSTGGRPPKQQIPKDKVTKAPKVAVAKVRKVKVAKVPKVKVAKVPKVKVAKAPKTATPSHPSFAEMVQEAVQNLKDRKGVSKQAIFSYIKEHFAIGDRVNLNNAFIRKAIKSAVNSGTLLQITGIGSNGRFKLPSAKNSASREKTVAIVKKSAAGKSTTKSAKKVKA